MSQPTSSAPTPQPAEPERPKSIWEKVITSTPILLTIVATLLAGMSSSEMTRAQYFRAVAAQNQSKVSDQWNFFQAKKIRGTDMDGIAIVLRSTTGAGKLSPESLEASTKRLSAQFKRARTEADALTKAVETAGSAATSVGPPAKQFRETTVTALAAAGKVIEKLDALAKETPEKSLVFLTSGTVPERVEPPPSAEEREKLDKARKEKREKLDKELSEIGKKVPDSLSYFDLDLLSSLYEKNPAIPHAVFQVNERKTEEQMADTLAKITPEQIRASIIDAENSASQFEERCRPITKKFRDLDKLIADQTGAGRAAYRSAQEVGLAAATLSSGDSKLSEVQQTAAAVERTGSMLRSATDELGNDFKAAQLTYDSRRYSQEASDNQAVAGLYELDVRKASLESDRHRHRSSNFFYAMLAAQGGVTIATFAIAMRRRSFLWGLATAAGLAAVTFGGYVFLAM